VSTYRMYFRSGNQIHGREHFESDDDVTAIHIARVLYDSCSEVCDRFELWHGNCEIRARKPHHQRASLADLTDAHQRVALEREEHISESRWLIARSRRLIEILDGSR
jgi:hypothetical protein